MPDKSFEGFDKMSSAYVTEARHMADTILTKVHRGPGDTIDAAMHRAERAYGVPAQWLHRLRYRYRDLRDIPASVYVPLLQAFSAINAASAAAYQHERELAHERNSALLGLAAALAGSENRGGAQ